LKALVHFCWLVIIVSLDSCCKMISFKTGLTWWGNIHLTPLLHKAPIRWQNFVNKAMSILLCLQNSVIWWVPYTMEVDDASRHCEPGFRTLLANELFATRIFIFFKFFSTFQNLLIILWIFFSRHGKIFEKNRFYVYMGF